MEKSIRSAMKKDEKKTFQFVSKFRFKFPIFARYQKGFNQVSFLSSSCQNVDKSKRQEEELEL